MLGLNLIYISKRGPSGWGYYSSIVDYTAMCHGLFEFAKVRSFSRIEYYSLEGVSDNEMSNVIDRHYQRSCMHIYN